MAAKIKTMSTVKQILRLFLQGKKIKFIARNCSVSKNITNPLFDIFPMLKLDNEDFQSES